MAGKNTDGMNKKKSSHIHLSKLGTCNFLVQTLKNVILFTVAWTWDVTIPKWWSSGRALVLLKRTVTSYKGHKRGGPALILKAELNIS